MTAAPAKYVTREELVDAGFVAGLSAIALYSFRSSFGGVEFMLPALVAVVAGIAVSHVTARRRTEPLLTAAITLVVYVLVVGTVALHDQATAGFLPSIDTLRTSLTSIVDGWKRLLTTSPPAGSRSGLMIVPAICGMVSTSVGYSVARRTRSAWVALLPVYGTLALGILCGVEQPVSTLAHGALLTVGAVTWMSVRHHRARPVVNHRPRPNRLAAAAGMLVAVSLAGLVVGPHLPMVDASERTVWRSELHPPFDPSLYPSPLNGYRRYIKALKDETLFTIEGVPVGVPIRLATMDVYDGLVWRVAGSADGTSGLFERVGDDVQPDFPGETTTVHVVIGRGFPADSVWVPTVGEVRSVRFGGPRAEQLTEAYRYNHTTDTAAAPVGLRPDDEYWLDVVVPTTRSEVEGRTDLEAIPQLAPDVTPIAAVTAFGADIEGVAAQPNKVLKAFALVDAMQRLGYYPDPEGDPLPSGHGAARLDRFVTARDLVGEAEQYAATAGLVATAYEVPVRVVMGYRLPDDATGSGPHAIHGDETEAWIEIPIAGAGWVALPTTPPRTQIPQQVDDQRDQPPDRPTQVPPPPPNIVPDIPVKPATGIVATKDRTKEQEEALAGESGSFTRMLLTSVAFASPALLLGGVFSLILGLKRRRGQQRRSHGAPNQRIANGWKELVDAFRDMGRPLPRVATRPELAAFTGAEVHDLALYADRAVFGPGEPTEADVDAYWAAVRATLKEMHGQMGFADRWKAKLSLTSLLTRES